MTEDDPTRGGDMELVVTDIDTGDEKARVGITVGEDVRVDTSRGIWQMGLENGSPDEDTDQ